MKKDFGYVIFSFIMICFISLNIFVINGSKKYIYLIITSLLTIIFAYFNYKKENISIQNKFLMLIIPLGIFYMLALPIGTIPDESNHFYRTYEISEGKLISKWDRKLKSAGNYLPTNIDKVNSNNYREIKQNIKINKSTEKAFIGFSNTALYSPVCYIPQVIGASIAKIFTNNFTIMAYFGRIFNFIIFCILIFFSIKIIPTKKNLILFISLLPITIQEAVSLSPDALTISSCTLLISFIFYLKGKKGLLNIREKLLIIILPIIIALCKIVYLPVCLLLFLIPKEKFGSLKRKNIFIFALAFFVVLINLLWTSKVSIFLTANLHGSNSAKQLKYILNYPFIYLKTLLNTFDIYADFHIFNMLGRYLSLFNVNVYAPYIYINLLVLLLLLIQNEKTKRETKKNLMLEKVLLIFCFTSTLILIFTSIYIQWTPYMLDYVDGVQGRYYLPIILLVGLAINNIFNFNIKENIMNKYILLFMIIENLSACLTIISVYS